MKGALQPQPPAAAPLGSGGAGGVLLWPGPGRHRQRALAWWVALAVSAVLAAWLLLSSSITEQARPRPAAAAVPLLAVLSSSGGDLRTAAARDMVPRLQARPVQETLFKRWLVDTAPRNSSAAVPPPPPGLRIPRLLHHVYFPGLEAYFKLTEDLGSNTRLRWGAACVHQHPADGGWRHVFWDMDAARELVLVHYPQYADMFTGMNNIINQANTIRYFIMHAMGGLYLDMDVECFRSTEQFLVGADVVLQGTPGGVTNGILASVPGHPIWEVALSKIHEQWQQGARMTAGAQGGLTGPILMTNALKALGPATGLVPEGGPYAGRHALLNSTVVVHPKGTWYVPCQYNEGDCHKRLVLERALGVASLHNLAGYHRYSASWMGGNAHGIHSMKGVVGALCGGVPGGAAAPYCKPVPCINQLCTPQPCLVATGSGGSSAPGSDAGGPSDAGEGDAAAGSPPLKALLPVKTRWSIPAILEREKLQTGAELGVQRGIFAEQVLKGWPSATRYYLIDAWQHQANYTDVANVGAAEQEARFQEARARMAPWLQKAVFFRNYTTEAAALIPDASLDFIYVDARHDYCGVQEDLQLYWPKLKSGGILAGHDYLDAPEIRARSKGHPRGEQDWSLCMDGSQHEGAVKGAVDEFAQAHGLSVVVTYAEHDFPSWMARKP